MQHPGGSIEQEPTEEEQMQLARLLEKHPKLVFQQLNKWMNQDGLMLSIRVIGEKKDISEH
ncbi:hypothetical protein [Serratia fonticola]|jgi:hypothetical protein|uniref:hypothetical protein n=1 Tax=Serratia fonticola TaxID=47917 RepID=UPI002178E263|nr:hypothetical protein [Serratia fonticola]CAI1011793.1 Uncharacterised protein [Serratia fonticola]